MAGNSMFACYVAIVTVGFIGSNGFLILKHIQSGKYLDYSGYASDKCSSRRFNVSWEHLAGYAWESLHEYKGQGGMSMTVVGGCGENNTIKMAPTRGWKSQLFRLTSEGTILTPCGAGLRLTLEDGTNRQVLDSYFRYHKVVNGTERFKFKFVNCGGDPNEYVYVPGKHE